MKKNQQSSRLQLNSYKLQKIMDVWSREADTTEMFYKIIKRKRSLFKRKHIDDVFVYVTQPGRFIGRAGEMINRYQKMVQALGGTKINIVEVRTGREPKITYGLETCPLPTTGMHCGDYERLGSLACGLCGADEELAADGRKCFERGIKMMME